MMTHQDVLNRLQEAFPEHSVSVEVQWWSHAHKNLWDDKDYHYTTEVSIRGFVVRKNGRLGIHVEACSLEDAISKMRNKLHGIEIDPEAEVPADLSEPTD